MKTRIIVALFITGIFILFTAPSFAQTKDCCKDGEKSNTECKTEKSTEQKDCCTDKTGKSGSDSSKTSGSVCLVSGESIETGQGVPFKYYSKNYEFCCEGCLKKFKKEPMKYIKDELVCPVEGDHVKQDVFVVHEGVKYYFCCAPCIGKFEKNPSKYIEGQNK